MTEELLAAIADQGPALLLAFWVIQKGEIINKQLLDRQEKIMQAMEASYRANQAELLEVLKTLCLPRGEG